MSGFSCDLILFLIADKEYRSLNVAFERSRIGLSSAIRRFSQVTTDKPDVTVNIATSLFNITILIGQASGDFFCLD